VTSSSLYCFRIEGSSHIYFSLSRGGYLIRNFDQLGIQEISLTNQRVSVDKRRRKQPEAEEAENRNMIELEKLDDDVSKEEMESRFLKIYRSESEMVKRGLY